jgi:phosphatidylserine decarboxylase
MGKSSLTYYDRYTGRLEEEAIYGGGWIRWLYETPAGQVALHVLIKRAFFSYWYGWRMNRPASRKKIEPFIEKFRLDPSEFDKPLSSFRTFNQFFYRRLKPGARPVAPGENVAVFPADGRHLCVPVIEESAGFLVKGATFTLDELFADAELAHRFRGGSMTLSRLCPVDYHRFHFPCAGRAGPAKLLKGHLFSVNTIALRRNIRYLVRNKRNVTLLESRNFGTVAYVEVGATCVGSILHTYRWDTDVRKGEEKGFFKFGGSCVILVFEAGRIHFDPDLIKHSREGIETYARMGDRLGTAP